MMSKWKQISSLVRSKALVPSLLPSSYTFTPNKEEVIESRFRLRYSTTCNSYYRDWSDAIDPSAQGVISGWDKVLYSVDSVHRQINEEAGQVYLERVLGANTGCIKWRINFGCCGLLVDEVTIRLSCVEDYGGEVVVTLMGIPGQKRIRYPIGSDYVTYTELENSSELTLTVHFVGEPGQVTRLFPQSILRGMGYPLDIQVILKPPLQSLGRPRILVGLLYSSSQEIEVDGRHYKQNTTNTGQGFLHIHLLRGMDLPQGKHGLPDPFAKCYLLSDAKKSTKCRTKARKGKDPLWNEQFLIVGVNFHDVKRRALEICIADSHTSIGKKAKLLGGVRLSLGYKAVVAQQTKQVSQVLRFFKGKGGVGGERKIDNGETVGTRERKVSFSDKDTVIANVNSSFVKWKRSSGKPLAVENTDKGEKEEKDADSADVEVNNNTGEEQITVKETVTNDENSNDVTKTGVAENEQQSASSTSTEDMAVAWDPLPAPTTNSEPESGSSPDASGAEFVDKGNERSAEERLFQSVLTSIKQLEIATRSSVTLEPSEEKELGLCNGLDKPDELRGINSCLMVSKGSLNEELGKEDFEKQESHEIFTQIIDSEAEQEKSGFKEIETLQEGDLSDDIKKANEINEEEKENLPQFAEQSHDEEGLEKNGLKEIEIQGNGDLVNERSLLNDVKEANVVSKTELENEEPPDSKEQNGDEFCRKVKEAIIQEKSTKEGSSLSSAVTKTPGGEKTLEGKYNGNYQPPNQEIEVVASQGNDHTKTQRALKKTSTGSSEMKRSPSLTFKDLAKKVSSGRRRRSNSEESGSETYLETNANKVMLDAEGLEITQWTLVVDRPKQWHYCWHILRPEMTILH